MERRVLVLRHLFHLAIELGSGSLIDAAAVGETQLAHSFQDAEHTDGIHVGSILWRVEADLHMALCGEVIDLSRAYLADHAEHTHRVAQVGIVKMEMWCALQMSDTWAEVH